MRNIVIIIIILAAVGFQLATKDSTQFILNRVKEAFVVDDKLFCVLCLMQNVYLNSITLTECFS